MDIFGTRWRIVEERKYPNSRNLSTKWIVQHKFLGLFWNTFIQDFRGGDEFSEFWEDFDSERRAKKALIEKLGEKKFYKKLSEGKIEFIRLPPIEFGVRIVETTSRTKGYFLKSGHYESGGKIFVMHDSVSEISENVNEVLMKADIKGYTVDNRQQYDQNCKIKDRYDGVLLL